MWRPRVVIGVIAIGLGAGACATSGSATRGESDIQRQAVVGSNPSPTEGAPPFVGAGEAMPAGARVETGAYGPSPVQNFPLLLMVGPGMARAFAAAGVARALADARVPLGGWVVSGFGAWIAALHATSRSIDEFEWKLMKMKVDVLRTRSRWNGNRGRHRKLAEVLRAEFGEMRLQDARVPLWVVTYVPDGARVSLVHEGKIADVLASAVAEESLFEFSGNDIARSAESVKPYPVTAAREMGLGPIVVIDTLPRPAADAPSIHGEAKDRGAEDRLYAKNMSAARVSAREELPLADLVLLPALGAIGYFDFDDRTKIRFQGKLIAIENMSELRALAGLPRNE